MLQLLPGGQAYLDAAAMYKVKINGGDTPYGRDIDKLQLSMHETHMCMHPVTISLMCLLDAQHAGETSLGDVAVLLPAAVRLLLEAQLLAAGLVQRLRTASKQQQQPQQQQQTEELQKDAEMLLLQTDHLLQLQIRAVLQVTGSSCLPPEVLQQAGLQLLQALAAPLQQLQLNASGAWLAEVDSEWRDCVHQQLLALRAAAAGMVQLQVGEQGRGCAAVVN
jgi:hypothetical protein